MSMICQSVLHLGIDEFQRDASFFSAAVLDKRARQRGMRIRTAYRHVENLPYKRSDQAIVGTIKRRRDLSEGH